MPDIEKPDLKSMNIKEHQLEMLKQLFPEAFTEGYKIDWEKLRLTLGEDIDTGKERFGMNWPGKADCFKTIQQPSIATLVPARDESVDFDTTQNLFIEGDNLEVLKLLQKSYLGKIKMIYIDPPYNTGNDFIYPDNYSESLETYLAYTGQIDSEGRKFNTNADTDGRFHSKWMNMVYPRLFLAKNLLRDDGLVFISIDDAECDNLKKLCDEIFGEENFIERIIWKNKYGSGALTKGFANVHEYVLCYSKSIIENITAPLDEDSIKAYDKNKDSKYPIRGGFVTQPFSTNSKDDRPNLVYPIYHKGVEILPDKQWIWSKERFQRAFENDEVVINEKDGKYSVRIKQYLKDDSGKIRNGKPVSIMNGPFNQEGTKEIKELFDGRDPFGFPKPSELIKYFGSFIVNDIEDKAGIYLDFFSGSCSTAQAILELNKQDNGTRKFICVQIPEPTDENSEAYKAGFKTIADIGKERVRRVIKKIKKEHNEKADMFKGDLAGLDLGFKVYRLSKSNFRLWNSDVDKTPETISKQLQIHIDHISPDAEQEAILYELLLKSGFELSTPIERLTIEKKTIFSVAEGVLLICLEKELTHNLIKTMAERKPTRVICLDEGFQNNDQLKTNAVQIMKSKGVIKFQTV